MEWSSVFSFSFDCVISILVDLMQLLFFIVFLLKLISFLQKVLKRLKAA